MLHRNIALAASGEDSQFVAGEIGAFHEHGASRLSQTIENQCLSILVRILLCN
jgi:hypothetical protein